MFETASRDAKHVTPPQTSSPGSFVWHGHEATTSAALLILLERATSGDLYFSHDERAFCTACEFWSAVATRSLDAYLRQEMVTCLSAAHVAFVRIGAAKIATVLEHALLQYPLDKPSSMARRRWNQSLGQKLLSTNDPVNRLLATFASTMLSNGH